MTTSTVKWVPVKCMRCRRQYITEADSRAAAEGGGIMNHACSRCGQSTRTIAGNALWRPEFGSWVRDFKPKSSRMNFDIYLLRSTPDVLDEKEWWLRASFANPDDAHEFARQNSDREAAVMRVADNRSALKNWTDYDCGVRRGV